MITIFYDHFGKKEFIGMKDIYWDGSRLQNDLHFKFGLIKQDSKFSKFMAKYWILKNIFVNYYSNNLSNTEVEVEKNKWIVFNKLLCWMNSAPYARDQSILLGACTRVDFLTRIWSQKFCTWTLNVHVHVIECTCYCKYYSQGIVVF